MDYKITKFNAVTAQIEVDFLLLPGFSLSIDLPVDEQGMVPTGIDLDNYIKGFLPYGTVDRMSKLSNGVANADAIQALIPTSDMDNLAGLSN